MPNTGYEVGIKKMEDKDLTVFVEVIRLCKDIFEKENFSMPGHNHCQNSLNRNDFFVTKRRFPS